MKRPCIVGKIQTFDFENKNKNENEIRFPLLERL